MFTPTGMQDAPAPRALTTEEIKATVQDFRHAAKRAIEAGADGVEIYGANGYLINQFFAPNANLRTDEYGGSIENRARFAIEVATAIADEIGPERAGFRISPGMPIGGLVDGEEGPALYRYLVAELDKLDLAYLHFIHDGDEALAKDIRKTWSNSLLLLRTKRSRDALGEDVELGLADVVPIGKWALANPDFIDGSAMAPNSMLPMLQPCSAEAPRATSTTLLWPKSTTLRWPKSRSPGPPPGGPGRPAGRDNNLQSHPHSAWCLLQARRHQFCPSGNPAPKFCGRFRLLAANLQAAAEPLQAQAAGRPSFLCREAKWRRAGWLHPAITASPA